MAAAQRVGVDEEKLNRSVISRIMDELKARGVDGGLRGEAPMPTLEIPPPPAFLCFDKVEDDACKCWLKVGKVCVRCVFNASRTRIEEAFKHACPKAVIISV